MKELLIAIGGYLVLRQAFGIDLLSYFTTPSTPATTTTPTTTTTPPTTPSASTSTSVTSGTTNTTNNNDTTVIPETPPATTVNTNFNETDWYSTMRARMSTVLINQGNPGFLPMTFTIDQWNYLMAEQGTTNLPGREEVGLTGDEQLGPDEYLRIIETVAQSKGIQGLGIGRLITPGGRIARTGYFAPDGSGHSTPTERMTITRW